MITPIQARKFIQLHAPVPKIERVSLSECLGFVLAADIKSPFPMPLADNSAMDGFVIRSYDTRRAGYPVYLKIKGGIKAGDPGPFRVTAGTAYRIMTGAFIPVGGDAVIAKEDAMIENGCLVLLRPVSKGRHIRFRGEEIKKGDVVLKRGLVLNPAAVGILASLGSAKIPVYQKPKVSVLATGSELVAPGEKLRRGKIYDSNSWMVRAALTQMGVKPLCVLTLRDEMRQVQSAIQKALRESDYLILLGGVSVGDYDVVKEALKQEGVKTVFWKVKQKPGKPLYFGRKGRKNIFGLPGNPAAVFTCFYEYVYPALRQTMGFKHPGLKQTTVELESVCVSDPKRHLFLKAQILKNKKSGVLIGRVLAHQGSHMLSSLSDAQGFIWVPPARRKWKKRNGLQFHFLPGSIES